MVGCVKFRPVAILIFKIFLFFIVKVGNVDLIFYFFLVGVLGGVVGGGDLITVGPNGLE